MPQKILGGPSKASVCLERTKSAPFGLDGGGAGGIGRIVVISPYGAERELNSQGAFTVPAGSKIRLRAPGSGGFGPAAERDRERLREGGINDYVVSPESAIAE
jgi:N-methylhydantoinase B